MGGARPEGADVPQDADSAPRGGVLVGAPAPGDEQDEAESDQPGAQGLRRLGRAVHDGVRLARRLTGRLLGGEAADQRSGAQEQRGCGDDGDEERCPVGEGGHRPGAGDTAGACGVRGLVRVVAFDRALLGAADPPGTPGQPADQGEHGHEERWDHGRLPGQQDGRAGDRGRGTVQPVGDALGDTAGHHSAERAGEQCDARAAEAAHRRARVAVGAVQEVGDHAEDDDEYALGQREGAEGGVPGQPAGRVPSRP
ncbi:hypothetical protein GCM10010121_017090 [Streptomyces brasiliensis]|uniref:Uncharacterized protein n=1 Tax=Streptomyces brasiliensis TaxID=1954 RepID=A0A917KBH8_9ACTN|nr:hypothetical protein GCM10010121_017090 [Streptomyces brasiliensis]